MRINLKSYILLRLTFKNCHLSLLPLCLRQHKFPIVVTDTTPKRSDAFNIMKCGIDVTFKDTTYWFLPSRVNMNVVINFAAQLQTSSVVPLLPCVQC